MLHYFTTDPEGYNEDQLASELEFTEFISKITYDMMASLRDVTLVFW